MKNIFAISGSLRAGSSNHAILRYLGGLMPANINYNIYDGLANIPAFDPGLDNNDPPAAVSDLRDKVAQADAIIICTPEYAYGVPGALKNALDWTVSSGSLSGKPTALITASTGGENVHEAMIKILGALDAKLAQETILLIPFVRTKIDANGNIIDNETVERLQNVLKSLLGSL
ncbi:MAG TPA: NADPH-dependent FMN reductase [Mucilaginibacter sp.]|jgi:NAD(P)H-dependent FMN reductase|nr:NADPH-dependent FMN reductase [Mucilaginibacter sp.]